MCAVLAIWGASCCLYLGNKRSLLGLLGSCFERLGQSRRVVSFADPFAGSGSVSRLARVMGYRVHANDWEPFSFCHQYLATWAFRAGMPTRCWAV